MRPPAEVVVRVESVVAASRESVFDVFAPIDLTRILRGYGPMPAVSAVEDQSGGWDAVGQTRTVRLADGTTMREALTAVERPRHFAYTITQLTGPLGRLTERFHGAWWFEPLDREGPTRTRARWQYRFEPRSALTRPLTALVVRGHRRR